MFLFNTLSAIDSIIWSLYLVSCTGQEGWVHKALSHSEEEAGAAGHQTSGNMGRSHCLPWCVQLCSVVSKSTERWNQWLQTLLLWNCWVSEPWPRLLHVISLVYSLDKKSYILCVCMWTCCNEFLGVWVGGCKFTLHVYTVVITFVVCAWSIR